MYGINLDQLNALIHSITDRKTVDLLVEKYNQCYSPTVNARDYDHLLHMAKGTN